jgi:hypothetical protein
LGFLTKTQHFPAFADKTLVAMTPFQDIPKKFFVIRMGLPVVGLFVFCFFLVGVIASSPAFQKFDAPASVIPFWESAFKHYHSFFAQIWSMPGFCLMGARVNEFQVHQCDSFWAEFLKVGGLALLPAVVVGGFLWIGLDSLKTAYRRAQNRFEKGVGAVVGVVTNPPEAPTDFYSWFYCFRPVMVQLPTQEQIKVHVPLFAHAPSPGQKLIAFELEKSSGEKRYVGMLYTPHVAVVRG